MSRASCPSPSAAATTGAGRSAPAGAASSLEQHLGLAVNAPALPSAQAPRSLAPPAPARPPPSPPPPLRPQLPPALRPDRRGAHPQHLTQRRGPDQAPRNVPHHAQRWVPRWPGAGPRAGMAVPPSPSGSPGAWRQPLNTPAPAHPSACAPAVIKLSGAGDEAIFMGVVRPACPDEHGSVRVWVAPGSGVILTADETCADQFGITAAELVGRGLSTLGPDIEAIDKWAAGGAWVGVWAAAACVPWLTRRVQNPSIAACFPLPQAGGGRDRPAARPDPGRPAQVPHAAAAQVRPAGRGLVCGRARSWRGAARWWRGLAWCPRAADRWVPTLGSCPPWTWRSRQSAAAPSRSASSS
jgi:PAS domain-containing protein